MFRVGIKKLAIGVILGLATITWFAGCATAMAPSKRVAMRAPDGMTADEAFVLARQYVNQESADQFEQVAARAAQHPLGIYVDYWRLKLRLIDRRIDTAPAPDADVQRFLNEQGSSLVADLLRRDWMLSLGRRGEWTTLLVQYPAWILKDDPQVHCYQLLARTQRGESVLPSARQLLAQTRELGDGCGALLEGLSRNGSFKRDDLRRRLMGALEANSAPSIRQIALLMNLDGERLDIALNRPAKILAALDGKELDLIALIRLARQDPKAAAEKIASLKLAAPDKSFAWSQIAAASMRRLDPEALGWVREGLAAEASDDTWSWLARAALRGQDWKTLSAAINRMSPEGQRDPAWIYWQARSLQAAGKRDEAEAMWRAIAGQYHFYGQLAAEEFGQLTLAPPRPTAPSEDELVEPERNAGFARALKFYELGLRPEGNREWNFQLRGLNDRQLLPPPIGPAAARCSTAA